MKYKRLFECAEFSKKRTSNIIIDNYVTTDNMLPNKGGIAIASSLPNVKSTSKYEINDILISNIRPYFKKIWFANKEGSCSNDVLVIKSKKDYLPKFLYYVLCDNNFFNYDTVTSKGTKMPRGTPNAIMKYLVPVLDFNSQKKIVEILSNYDLTIENNNKRIKILEKMAENLYKEWFVRFRFPGHEKAEFENGLPKGWKQYHIKELCEINNKTISKNDKNENIIYLDTGSLTENVVYALDNYKISEAPSRAKRKVKYNSILFSTVRPILKHYGILKNVTENLIVSTGFAVLDSKYDIANILFLFLSSDTVVNYCQTVAENAVATYPSIKPEEIGKIKIILPPLEIAINWNKKFESIFLLRQKLIEANTNLTKQRDLLLPRLMSGKLTC